MSKQAYAEAVNAKAVSMRKAGPKKLRSIEIEHADNGGHVVTHRFHSGDGPYHEPETHVFGKTEGAKLMAHLKEHAQINDGDADDKE